MIKLSENTIFADRYQFQRLLGRGGFSEVWLAVDKMTDLEIAVKVYAPGQGMDSDGMKDFCNELSQVYNLNHTNLLKPQHVDSWEGMPYLVMTYCPDGSCHRMIGAMDEEQIWKILHDVASGLAYLHEQGIIHQDIKPDNILVDPLGNYVITDFGISVQSRSTLRKSMNIASGSGTTAYMGPERFSTDPTPLKASDIWSLGATAYELLTGNAPFGEIGGGMQKGGADLPTIKQDISPEMRMVLAKMLALETWNRPTAEQLVKWTEDPQQIDFSVNNTAGYESSVKKTVTTLAGQPKQRNKKSLIICIIAAVILLLCSGGAWLITENHKASVARNKHKELFLSCQNAISSNLTEDNFTNSKLDDAILKLRLLERVETNPNETKYIDKKMLPIAMNDFIRHLETVKQEYSKIIDSGKHDKNGPIVSKYRDRIKRINQVLNELENSETKTPQDIHLTIENN